MKLAWLCMALRASAGEEPRASSARVAQDMASKALEPFGRTQVHDTETQLRERPDRDLARGVA